MSKLAPEDKTYRRDSGQPVPQGYSCDLNLLRDTLMACVPLAILELSARGGPNDYDWELAHQIGYDIGTFGDLLIFPPASQRQVGKAADLVSGLIRAIAVMAFAPGGCDVLGQHWEVSQSPAN